MFELIFAALAIMFMGLRIVKYREVSFWLIMFECAAAIMLTIFLYFMIFTPSTSSVVSQTNYYLQPNTNSLTGFNNLTLINYPSLTSNAVTLSNTAMGVELIHQFETNSTTPALALITPGPYQIHLHASTNGSVALYEQVWMMNGSGTNANLYMIGQTQLSPKLNLMDNEYIGTFTNNYTYSIAPTDRIAVYVFANVTSFSTPVNVILYYGGAANPHLSMPTETANPNLTTPGVELDVVAVALFDAICLIMVILDAPAIWFRKSLPGTPSMPR